MKADLSLALYRIEKAPLWSFFAFCLLLTSIVPATSIAGVSPSSAAISSAHPLATEAGFAMLEAGGNAFDAAVAVSAVLAVVEPYSSGLGGGGFWLLHRASDNLDVMVDGREKAPSAAHRDLYLDEQGKVIDGLSINGPLAAGIPGEPAALAHIAKKFGQLSFAATLAPAIKAAKEGFLVDEHYRQMATWRLKALNDSPSAAQQFLLDKAVPPLKHIIRQPALADTLRALAEQGHAGFYRGKVAEQLVASVQQAGGNWQLKDLAEYAVVEREPMKGQYRGWNIVSAAPPSSGGIVLINMLNILSQFDLDKVASAERKHLLVEAMRRAYRDRAKYLGDPDYISMPVNRLTHPFYATGLARDIQLHKATPSLPTNPVVKAAEGMDTTHFSVLDKQGNRVAATLSINYPFGSGFVAAGTGVLLNDEMDDFSAKPGTPNVYGLVGGEANAISPGKRMLSSMTPTFVESDQGVAIIGSPGGSRIITMVLRAVLGLSEGKGPTDWVSEPRFHHQYLPDVIQYEPGALDQEEVTGLMNKGHKLKALTRRFGNMQVVFWDKKTGKVSAASDPRGGGVSIVR